MAYYAEQAAMTGTAIPLSTIFGAGVPYARYVRVQGATANAAAVSVGNSDLTTTTNIGASTGPVASVTDPIVIGPFDSPSISLASIYVVGANTEIAYLSVVA